MSARHAKIVRGGVFQTDIKYINYSSYICLPVFLFGRTLEAGSVEELEVFVADKESLTVSPATPGASGPDPDDSAFIGTMWMQLALAQRQSERQKMLIKEQDRTGSKGKNRGIEEASRKGVAGHSTTVERQKVDSGPLDCKGLQEKLLATVERAVSAGPVTCPTATTKDVCSSGK
ncbi:hypothetical protein K438DRAFT_1782616 [Mycena galopus ATCC 62051]|nr:hypothetical protein K438DRAFT_1782616 [Mycena galopus ATCC 62051]